MLRKTILCGVALLAVTFAFAPSAQATLFDIEDDNSLASVDTESDAGMYDWVVDGVDHLFQQWFWYRVGDDAEAAISDLAIDVEGTTDADFDGDDETLFVRYEGDGFEIEVKFTLSGGTAGSNTSDMAEQIKIINTGDGSLDFHFFQYSDFDLNDTQSDDSAWLVNANTIKQVDSGGGLVFSETVATPAPDHWEIAFFSAIEDKLDDDADADDLSDATSPLGPGDITWAFQWDITIAEGGSFVISKDKRLAPIPAPGAALLGAIGLGLVGWLRRRMA